MFLSTRRMASRRPCTERPDADGIGERGEMIPELKEELGAAASICNRRCLLVSKKLEKEDIRSAGIETES